MSHFLKHRGVPSDPALRVKVLESLLVEKGLCDSKAIDELVDLYERQIGPRNGVKIVVKAWTDSKYRICLLKDAMVAIRSMGYKGRQGEQMKVLENTDVIHNVVVCTLCSCYPWPILGLPPVWYKSAPYRSRIVSNPREVLSEFGTVLDEKVEIRVWDSTSEMRYLVLPERPSGTENFKIDELKKLVTRNSMIGVEKAIDPVISES